MWSGVVLCKGTNTLELKLKCSANNKIMFFCATRASTEQS